MYSDADRHWMQRALALARQGLWTTMPNPRVGCVIVDADGELVGEGFHVRAGEGHAEVVALARAGARARGATAYVTLEPCSHHGRTPPCADGLVAAGVARVIAAMEDPNPLVAGRGLARLRAAGIDVRCGLLEAEARELNVGFVSRMTRGLPWVRLKVAASLDGRTALPDGRSQWITGEVARADGHGWRARACAILTGIGTVRDDDPRLTVRGVAGHPDAPLDARVAMSPRQPVRVLVDSRLEVPEDAQVLGEGTVVVHALDDAAMAAAPDAVRAKAARLQDAGIELVALPGEVKAHAGDGSRAAKVDLPALVRELARRGFNEVHAEAGAKLNASLLREGCVDELLAYLAPMLLGDSRPMFELPAPASLEAARRLVLHDVARVGEDIRVLARFA